MSLARRRSLPPGGTAATRTMRDGWSLRTVVWPAGPAGSLLALGGRGDFVEKYAEALWHWRDRGYGLAAFDWRGQGRSGRVGDTPRHGHSAGFDPLVADLGEQVAWFRAALPPPHFAVAHSMGAHLLLRHLAAVPASLDRAVLLAPMLGLRAPPLGPWLTRRLAAAAVARGAGGAFVPGAATPSAERAARLTGDPDRRGDEGWWVATDPEVAIGGVTWGWLAAAFASLDALAASDLGEVPPLLILTAANDALVDNAATARLARRLPHARVETVTGARHELLRETDAIRTHVLAAVDAFLA